MCVYRGGMGVGMGMGGPGHARQVCFGLGTSSGWSVGVGGSQGVWSELFMFCWPQSTYFHCLCSAIVLLCLTCPPDLPSV